MPRQPAATSAPPAPAAAPTCAPATPGPDNPHGLCDPCLTLVASCAPYIPDGSREPAPPDVNLVELVAGLMLTHDALHPGEPLYLREALAAHGVEADHVKVWQTVGKLRRRHWRYFAPGSQHPAVGRSVLSAAVTAVPVAIVVDDAGGAVVAAGSRVATRLAWVSAVVPAVIGATSARRSMPRGSLASASPSLRGVADTLVLGWPGGTSAASIGAGTVGSAAARGGCPRLGSTGLRPVGRGERPADRDDDRDRCDEHEER